MRRVADYRVRLRSNWRPLCFYSAYGRNLGSLEIAKACQRAEHRFAGVRWGLLDQVTSLFGRADHTVFFDCRSEEVRGIPFPQGLALIIAESGKKRELRKGEYNARCRETRAAADALQVSALRDVTSVALTSRRGLPDLLRRRAAHVVEENERVLRALELLAVGDGPGFGGLMNASHESSRKNFENSTRQSLTARLDCATAARRSWRASDRRRFRWGDDHSLSTVCRRKYRGRVI